jgi:hypothetical protein
MAIKAPAKKPAARKRANKAESVLVLRTCDANMQGHNGFQWPETGRVEAPDWSPEPSCGHGLHGLLWGEGDGSYLNWDASARWLVVEVDAASIVDIGGKVKYPAGDVLFCGDRLEATALLAERAPGRAIVGGTLIGGDDSTLTGGDRSTLTGGDRSTLTGGNRSTLTGGNDSTLTGGYYSTLTGGYYSTLTGGDRSTLTGGYASTLTGGNRSTLTGGNDSTLTGGDRSTLTGGYYSTLTGGYASTLTGGDRSTLTGGDRSTLTGGYYSTLTGGNGSTLTGGDASTLILRWYSATEGRYRTQLAEVGVDGIKADRAYRLNDRGEFVEVGS